MLNVKDTSTVSKTVNDYINSRYIPHTVSNKIYQIKVQDLDEIIKNLTFKSNYVNSDAMEGTDLLRKIIKVLYDAKDIPSATTIVLIIPEALHSEYQNYINLDFGLTSYGIFTARDSVTSFGEESVSSLEYEWVLFTDDIKDLEDFNLKKQEYKKKFNINSVKEPSAVYCEKAVEYDDIKRLQNILANTVSSLWFVCKHYNMFEEENETVETIAYMQNEKSLSILTLKDLVFKEGSLFSVSMTDYFEVGWEFLQQLIKENNNILMLDSPTGERDLNSDLPTAVSLNDREIQHNSIKVLYTTLAIYSVLSGNLVAVERYENLFNQLLSIVNNLDRLPLSYRISNKVYDKYMFMYANNAQLCRLVKLDNISESVNLKEFDYDELLSAYYKDDVIKPNIVTRRLEEIELLNTIDFIVKESEKYENVSLTGNVLSNNTDFRGVDNLVKLIVGALSQYVLNFEDIVNLRDILIYKVKNSSKVKIALGHLNMTADITGYHTSRLSVKENKVVSYDTTLDMDTTETLYRLNLCLDYKEFINDLGLTDCNTEEVLKPIMYDEETLRLVFNCIIAEFENRKNYSVFNRETPRNYLLGRLFPDDSEFESYLLPILKNFTSIKHIYKTGLIDSYKRVQALGKDDKILINEKFFGSKYSITEQLK